ALAPPFPGSLALSRSFPSSSLFALASQPPSLNLPLPPPPPPPATASRNAQANQPRRATAPGDNCVPEPARRSSASLSGSEHLCAVQREVELPSTPRGRADWQPAGLEADQPRPVAQGTSGLKALQEALARNIKTSIRSLSPAKLMSSQPMESPGRAGQKEPFFTNKRYSQSLSSIKHTGACISLPS
ncbi:hypothetical protein LEMLEM_LOCUS25130, partial [Lemmus lemmus]